MAQELKHRKGWVAVKELELRRANTKGWAVVGRTSIEQEETAEVIVPQRGTKREKSNFHTIAGRGHKNRKIPASYVF